MRGAILAIVASVILAACQGQSWQEPGQRPTVVVPGGTAERGKRIVDQYACGSCHIIPGVSGANGTVGPPLTAWSRRTYIAGKSSNTPDNLVRFIRFPQSVEPGTAMPDLAVTEQDARDIAAYLYTIK
jgi:cytochrome c